MQGEKKREREREIRTERERERERGEKGEGGRGKREIKIGLQSLFKKELLKTCEQRSAVFRVAF